MRRPKVTLPDNAEVLAARYLRTRAQTEALARPLSAEDQLAQSMPDASPTKWHLAHTSWFFETFVLGPAEPSARLGRPEFRVLYNSYYHGVGDQFPRDRRGLLSRPALEEVRRYRAEVDARVVDAIGRGLAPDLAELVVLGIEHEHQHQELVLTDIKHLLAQNPLAPAYRQDLALPGPGDAPGPLRWHRFDGGLVELGHDPEGANDFHFDNEAPRHRRWLEPFELAARPVSNGEYLAFIEDGGYTRPELWLSDGWLARERGGEAWRAPLYWRASEGAWREFTLGGLRELDLGAPVCHLSHYEADAYARWAGARLPDEHEWEHAATHRPVAGNLLEADHLHPVPPGSAGPPDGLYGDVWCWTRSAYLPYPGYAPPEGAVGEYNGKFMSGQMVLRGGSCVTATEHLRPTYRNFFPPHARWQFTGLRLARDL